jgi:hypothetical protein
VCPNRNNDSQSDLQEIAIKIRGGARIETGENIIFILLPGFEKLIHNFELPKKLGCTGYILQD